MKSRPSLVEGVVIATNDPQQMGRVKVWVPSVDGENYLAENLPWATYVSQFAGQTRDYAAGSSETRTPGFMSYGMWAIPKVGALVIVGFIYDDPNQRFYLGSYFRDHGNRSLPQGRNRPDLGKVPISDTLDPVQPQTNNLNTQFGGKVDAPEARTRGVYERAAAQDKTIKDGAEGYQQDVFNQALDPQTYCITTPGRHSLIMQDHPTTGRVRIKTAEGHQVILDDANERIYISTAKGGTWIELDLDGHVHIYGGQSVSVASGANINLSALGNINLQAGANINLSAGGWLRGSACSDASITGDKGLNLTSGAAANLLASGTILQTGSNIHLNGPTAETAPCASKAELVPNHEPWVRPTSKSTRGKNWRK